MPFWGWGKKRLAYEVSTINTHPPHKMPTGKKQKQAPGGTTKRALEKKKKGALSNGYKACLSEINAFLNGGDCGAQTLQGCYKTLFRRKCAVTKCQKCIAKPRPTSMSTDGLSLNSVSTYSFVCGHSLSRLLTRAVCACVRHSTVTCVRACLVRRDETPSLKFVFKFSLA